MKHLFYSAFFIFLSLSAQAEDHYFVTGSANVRVTTAPQTFDCELEAANQSRADDAIEKMKLAATKNAADQCQSFDNIVHLPNVNLIRDYDTHIECQGFGSWMVVKASGVFECVP